MSCYPIFDESDRWKLTFVPTSRFIETGNFILIGCRLVHCRMARSSSRGSATLWRRRSWMTAGGTGPGSAKFGPMMSTSITLTLATTASSARHRSDCYGSHLLPPTFYTKSIHYYSHNWNPECNTVFQRLCTNKYFYCNTYYPRNFSVASPSLGTYCHTTPRIHRW